MDGGGGRGTLKGNLQIALEEGAAHTAQNLVVIPSGSDDLVNQGRHRQNATSVLGQQGAALLVVAALDVLGISIDILGALADLLNSHFVFLLNRFVSNFACAVRNGGAKVGLALFGLLAVLNLVIDCANLGFKRVKVSFRRVQFHSNSGTAFHKLINGHSGKVHYFTSIKSLILRFCRSRFSRSR